VEERVLGKTGRAVSVVGLGTWQLGADWGEVADDDALAALEAATQAGSRSSTQPTFTVMAAASG
jgi:aryl-alcohol dehydrogenase-like predicted oxidoreductase